MEITKEDVLHYARLSKIKIDNIYAQQLAGQMTEIQHYVSKLNEVDVSGVEPTAQVSGLTNVSRADKLIDYGVSDDALLESSAEYDSHGIKVPKVL